MIGNSCRIAFAACLGATLASATVTAVNAREDDYVLEVYKTGQELLVKQGEHVVRRYPVATGRGGGGTKQRLGDKKTPVGVYKIVEFKNDSQFYYFMQLDYPNLLDAWYGYKHRIISASEFRAIATAVKNNQKPPQDTALGGYIGIHGLGEQNGEKLEIHEAANWTKGCIALTNEQINELRKFVRIGTRVVIRD
jgi:murein L,D-transpeptidase YafK